ncbi:protein TsetseEP-like [Condylostylus longicornis]|uniref:protein TsetseEP-like n=1 Tax=Condylostylus longicornis TaxID=2530218 RepID=UPI00244DB5FA|nr:protein TsetseEP-like [Condylostylus longicornis]
MKFAIVLTIAICAIINVNPSPIHPDHFSILPASYQIEYIAQNGIVQKLIEIIQNVIKKTQAILQDILSKLEDIIQSIGDKIQKIIDESKEIIDGIANGLINKLEEIAKKDELSRLCVEKSRPDLDIAIAKHGLSIEECRENAVKQIQNIRSEIDVYIEGIRSNIDALEDIVSDCLESTSTPLKLIQCIIKRTDDIRAQLTDLIVNAKKAIATGPNRSIQIIREAHSCVRSANVEFQKAAGEIISNVLHCIKNGFPEPEPEPEPEPKPQPEPKPEPEPQPEPELELKLQRK